MSDMEGSHLPLYRDLGLERGRDCVGAHSKQWRNWAMNQGLLSPSQALVPSPLISKPPSKVPVLWTCPLVLPALLPTIRRAEMKWDRRHSGMQRDSFLGCRGFHSGTEAENLFMRALSPGMGPPCHSSVWTEGLGWGGKYWLQAVPGTGPSVAMWLHTPGICALYSPPCLGFLVTSPFPCDREIHHHQG